jgi:hypothetical protein
MRIRLGYESIDKRSDKVDEVGERWGIYIILIYVAQLFNKTISISKHQMFDNETCNPD